MKLNYIIIHGSEREYELSDKIHFDGEPYEIVEKDVDMETRETEYRAEPIQLS